MRIKIGELGALRGVQHAVDPSQRLDHRVAQALGALHPQIAAFLRARLVELLEAQRVRERGHRAAVVHRGLGALRLQLVEDLGELRHLLFAEVQLVGEKAQRPAHAESAAAELVACAAAPRTGLPARGIACVRAFAAAVLPARLLPPPHHAWVHFFSSSPGRFAPGRGLQGVGTMPHAARAKLTPAPRKSTPRCGERAEAANLRGTMQWCPQWLATP